MYITNGTGVFDGFWILFLYRYYLNEIRFCNREMLMKAFPKITPIHI